MKKHLTELSVERIRPPKEGQIEVFDLGYPGLALRIGHGGAKTFEQFYKLNGKLRRDTLGRWPSISLADARDMWRTTRQAIAKGEAPQHNGVKAPAMLFEVVVEEWLKRDQAENKSVKQVVYALDADLLPAWRGKRVDEITKRDIHDLLDSIEERSMWQARKVQAHVNRFFAWCRGREIVKVDPTDGMERVGTNKSRDRFLSDAELAKVWRAADGVYGSVVRMLALTGARREEIAQLRWSEIDGNTITLEGARTKTGAPHIIPLSAAAQTLLAGVPRICEYVFTPNGTKPITDWSNQKIALDAAAGVTGWRIHDLRRTVATGMQKLGVTLQVVEAVLGHTSGSRSGIVGVYQRHNYADEKRAALEAWGDHVHSLAIPG